MKTLTAEQVCDLAEAGDLQALLDRDGPLTMTLGGKVIATVHPPTDTRIALHIRSYRPADEADVIELWRQCGLLRPWNDPLRDIARKLSEQPEGLLVGTVDEQAVGVAMVGFDGHRGWVNYLAVSPAHRHASIGTALMVEAERWLLQRGCPKLNVQVRSSNADVIAFYRRLGYVQDDVVSFGKRLIDDAAASAE